MLPEADATRGKDDKMLCAATWSSTTATGNARRMDIVDDWIEE
jgi:hypothetical protein